MFYNLERVCGGIVFTGRFALSEAGDTQVVVGAVVVSASDADLSGHVSIQRTDHAQVNGKQRTVAVMSAEQMSQMYLMPPSVVLTAVFFLMRPMVAHVRAWARGVVPSWGHRGVNMVA